MKQKWQVEIKLKRHMSKLDSRKIAPEENCPPALILTLILNQTLTLNGRQFSSGAIFRTPKIRRFSMDFYKVAWLGTFLEMIYEQDVYINIVKISGSYTDSMYDQVFLKKLYYIWNSWKIDNWLYNFSVTGTDPPTH